MLFVSEKQKFHAMHYRKNFILQIFFLNFSFFLDEEFKIILTKYPKKPLIWNYLKETYSFSRVIATLTSIYPAPHIAILQTILKCRPPILQQLFPFSRVSIIYCLKTDANLIRVLLWSYFRMLATNEFSWKLYIEYILSKR